MMRPSLPRAWDFPRDRSEGAEGYRHSIVTAPTKHTYYVCELGK